MGQIAKNAGVSCVTVSRALNTPEKVRPETLARIRSVCQQMNFSPRVIPNRIRTVCLIIPAPPHFYMGDNVMLSTIVSLLNEQRYHVVVSPLSEIERSPLIFQRAFIAILHQEDAASLTVARKFASKVPFVTIDDLTEELAPEAILVSSDHTQGGAMATRHFLERGHRKIAYVGSKVVSRGVRAHFDGYKEVMEQNDLFRQSLVFQNDDSLLLEGIQRLCAEGMTALFCPEPSWLPKVLFFLRLFNKDFPRDVSVIGQEYDGGPRFTYPPITCLVQPLKKVAELAVGKLVKRMEGQPVDQRKCCVPYELAERESVRDL